MGDYSWIGGILEGAFGAATAITTTVVNGKTQQATIEANAGVTETSKTQNNKTIRTLIIGGVVLGAIVLFGLFVWSNRRK